MRKILTALMILFAAYGSAYSEPYDVSGTWLIKGVGHVDKSFVRSSLALSGYMNFQTESDELLNYITSYDAYLRIDATGLNIKVYDEHIENGIIDVIPIPTEIPSGSYPFELPTVTYDGLTYKVIITSATSGTVTIQGEIRDVSVLGTVDLDSDCKIWKSGTPEPQIDEGKSSGCDSGVGVFALLLLSMGVIGRVRN